MKSMKLKFLFWLIFSNSLLFATTLNIEAINYSLKSMQCNLIINNDSKFLNTIKKYNSHTNSRYQRYLATKELHQKIYLKFSEKYIPSFFTLIPYNESGFNPKIKGAGTVGLWQFGIQSGRYFGLKINKKKDERLDINRSTDAAIKYFLYLKKKYYKWYLVDFAYGMGEKRLDSLIAKHRSDEFLTILNDANFPKGTKVHFIHTLLLDAKIFTNNNLAIF